MNKIIAAMGITTFLMSAATFASDVYFEIKGAAGTSQIQQCPNGECMMPSLAPDTYTISVVDAGGALVAMDKTQLECALTGPKDTSGKRMHKPFVISKEMAAFNLPVTEATSNVAIACVEEPFVAKPATTKPAVPVAVKKVVNDVKAVTK